MNSNTFPAAPYVIPQRTTKLVCMGDSFTWVYWNNTDGYQYCDAIRHWTNLVSVQLGIEVINSGLGGHTTLMQRDRFQTDVIDHHPTHCIIEGFTNDVNRHYALDVTMGCIATMVDMCKANGIIPLLMNALPGWSYTNGNWYDPNKDWLRVGQPGFNAVDLPGQTGNNAYNSGSTGYNYFWEISTACPNLQDVRAAQKEYAKTNNIALIDIYTPFLKTSTTQDDSLYIYDKVHPNERGCMVIGAQVIATLKEVI